MARTRLTSAQLDWTSLGLNMKTAKNSTSATPSNGSHTNLASNGASISFTVDGACKAYVMVEVTTASTTDCEHKPGIFLDGSLHSSTDAIATVGLASGRGFQRTHNSVVDLTSGAHTLSASIFVASATGPNVAIGSARITAVVLGRVTA